MATIVTRAGKGSALTYAEADANFTNLNDEAAINTAKVTNATHTGDATGATALTLATVNANVGSFGIAGSVPQITVNAKGLTTAAANVAIAVTASQVTDFNSASRAQTEAEIVAGTNITITPGGSGATRTLTIAAAGGGATNLSYTAATRVIASDTGTDATLPLMSSGDAGLVPASGGGTANFLRADGTFAAPGGGGGATLITAAPASDQADWNPAGFGSGVGFIKLQPTTNSFLTGISAGATDQFLTLFNDSDFVVCIEGESGASTAANRFRKRALTMWLLPQETMSFRYSATAARWALFEDSKKLYSTDHRAQIFAPSNTTIITTIGSPQSATTATVSTVVPSGTPTDDFTEHASVQVTNSTGAGTSSIRGITTAWMRGATAFRQGFFHAGLVQFTALGATGAVRSGLSTVIGVSTALNDAQVNCLLVGAQAANTTLRVYSGGAAPGTPVDLGANFPCPSATAAYEYCFYARPNSAFVRYMVRRLDARFVAEGSLTSNLPVNTTALLQRLEIMVGATAVANTARAQYLYTQGL